MPYDGGLRVIRHAPLAKEDTDGGGATLAAICNGIGTATRGSRYGVKRTIARLGSRHLGAPP